MNYFMLLNKHIDELAQYYFCDDNLEIFAFKVPDDVAALYKLKGYYIVTAKDDDDLSDRMWDYEQTLENNDIRAWY